MKQKNKKGIASTELLLVLAFIIVIVAIVAWLFLSNDHNKRKYEVLAENARDFSVRVSEYRDKYLKYDDVIYLADLVNNNYIKAFKNPFGGDATCDIYESKIEIVSNSERYVTLRCGNYLIDRQDTSSNEYKVYKVSDWKDNISDSELVQSAKLYNYQKDGKNVLSSYVTEKELIDSYNQKESQDIETIEEIDLKKFAITTKTFYRTKELVAENL